MSKTISEKIIANLQNSSQDRKLFIDKDGSIVTCAEFEKLVLVFQNFILAKSVLPGLRIGLYLERSVRSIAAIVAILRVGAVAVPLDFHSVPERALSVFSDAQIRFAICDSLKLKELLARTSEKIELFSTMEIESFQYQPQKNIYIETPDDPAYITYTSGTTGRPKGVLLSRKAIDGYLTWFSSIANSSDRFVMALPFSTTVSLVDVFSPFYSNCLGVVFPEKLSKEPREFVRYMEKQNTTILMLPATVLHMLVSFGDLSKKNVPSLTKTLFGASAYPADQLRVMRAALHEVEITHLYGNTETGIVCSQKVPELFIDEKDLFLPVGKICSHLQGRLERNISGFVFPDNEGELWVSGANIMTSYWNRPEQTTKKLVKDIKGAIWYRTGDIARELAPGCFQLIGRVDRLFKKNGYQVEPEEIERQLSLLKEISTVAVIPQKRSSGESLAYSYIIKKPDVDLSIIKLKKYCSEKLPSHMIPDRFIFLSEFPKTSSGKIDYIKLAEIKNDQEFE